MNCPLKGEAYASALSGGKFANGAATAAFANLFASGLRSNGFGAGSGSGVGGGVTANGTVTVGNSTFDYTTNGPEGYAEQVNKLLVEIASTDAGTALLTEISGNGGNVQFSYTEGNAVSKGSLLSRNTEILFNPARSQQIDTTVGSLEAQSRFILAHELHHAWKNTLSCWFGCSRPLVLPGKAPRGLPPFEAHAVRYTNLIRTQAGVGYQRTHYNGIFIP